MSTRGAAAVPIRARTPIRSLFQRLLGAAGYVLQRRRDPVEPWVAGRDAAEVRQAIALVRPYTMLSDQRLASLYDQVRFLDRTGIRGGIVECGTWRGGAAGLMAVANRTHGAERRRLHLFDSFAGIPEPDEAVDGDRAVAEARRFGTGTGGRVVSNPQFYRKMGRDYGALESCRELLEEVLGCDTEILHYHKGFFQDTVPAEAARIGPIALLHLDGDWYASTKVCLEHLYDHVVPGGLVVIDDYGAYEGCRRAVDEFLAQREARLYLFPVDDEVRAFQKP